MNNESHLKLEDEMNEEILILRCKLEIAINALNKIGYPGYLTRDIPDSEVARLALKNIEKVKGQT